MREPEGGEKGLVCSIRRHDPTEHPQYNAMHDVTFEVGRHFVCSSQADWKLEWDRKISERWPDVGELAVKEDVTRAVS